MQSNPASAAVNVIDDSIHDCTFLLREVFDASYDRLNKNELVIEYMAALTALLAQQVDAQLTNEAQSFISSYTELLRLSSAESGLTDFAAAINTTAWANVVSMYFGRHSTKAFSSTLSKRLLHFANQELSTAGKRTFADAIYHVMLSTRKRYSDRQYVW